MSSGCGEFSCVCPGVCLDRDVQFPGGWQYSAALGSMVRELEQGRDNVSYACMEFRFESSRPGKG